MQVFNLEKLRATQSSYKQPLMSTASKIIFCLATLGALTNAVVDGYLPDTNGALFEKKLSYTMTAVADPSATNTCATHLPKMRANVVTTTIDATNNVYLTTFGWDDHNHSPKPGYCKINPTTFAWSTYNTVGPVSTAATIRKAGSPYIYPVGIDFKSSSTGTSLGATNTCKPPGLTTYA